MNELLHAKIPCLDHGFVQLMDVMGDDKAIVDAARLSIAGEKVRAVQDDRGLIRYLMRHRHTTPFEMVEFKFMCKMPIFVARQWIRHRTASVNEMSARYSELPEEFYVPAVDQVAFQDKKNKQGRAELLDINDAGLVVDALDRGARNAFSTYHELLGQPTEPHGVFQTMEQLAALRAGGGIARELARINLPLSTYTQWVWKQNLHNLLHLLALRLDKHAQYEIRVYAEAMASIVKQICPIAWEAFEDFRLNAIALSADEVRLLRAKISAAPGTTVVINMKTRREEEEFKEKLERFGLAIKT